MKSHQQTPIRAYQDHKRSSSSKIIFSLDQSDNKNNTLYQDKHQLRKSLPKIENNILSTMLSSFIPIKKTPKSLNSNILFNRSITLFPESKFFGKQHQYYASNKTLKTDLSVKNDLKIQTESPSPSNQISVTMKDIHQEYYNKKGYNDSFSYFSTLWHETLGEKQSFMIFNKDDNKGNSIDDKSKMSDLELLKQNKGTLINLRGIIRQFKDVKKTYVGVSNLGNSLSNQQQNLLLFFQNLIKEINEIEKLPTKEGISNKIKEEHEILDNKIIEMKNHVETMTEQIDKLKNWQIEEYDKNYSGNHTTKLPSELEIQSFVNPDIQQQFSLFDSNINQTRTDDTVMNIGGIKLKDKSTNGDAYVDIIELPFYSTHHIEQSKFSTESLNIKYNKQAIQDNQNTYTMIFTLFKEYYENTENDLKNSLSSMNLLNSEVDSCPFDNEFYETRMKKIEEIKYIIDANSHKIKEKLFPLIKPFKTYTMNYLISCHRSISLSIYKCTNIKNCLIKIIKLIEELHDFKKKNKYQDLVDKNYRIKYDKSIKSYKENLSQYANNIRNFVNQTSPTATLLLSVKEYFQYDEKNLENLDLIVKMIEKAIIGLKNLVLFEVEYDKKRYLAYKSIIDMSNMIDIFNQNVKLEINLHNIDSLDDIWYKAEKLKKVVMNNIYNMNTLCMAILKKKEISILDKLLDKSYMICQKLIIRLESKNKELDQIMMVFKDKILIYYQDLINKSNVFIQDIESYMKDVLLDHQNNSNMQNNNNNKQEQLAIIDTMIRDIEEYILLFDKLNIIKFIQFNPSIIQNLQNYHKLKNQMFILRKLLNLRSDISNNMIINAFKNLESRNITNQLNEFIKIISKIINELEQAIINLNNYEDDNSNQLLKSVLEDNLNKWYNLQLLVNKLFNFEIKINEIYHEYSNDLNSHSNDSIEDNIECLNEDNDKIKEIYIIYNKIESIYDDLIKDCFTSNNHNNNDQIILIIKTNVLNMKEKEFVELESICQIAEKVVNNSIIYNQYFKNLHYIPNLINNFSKWADNLQFLRGNGQKVHEISIKIDNYYSKLDSLKLEIQPKVNYFVTYQRKISNMIDVILELFSIGSWLTEKKLRGYLGKSLRTEKTEMEDYLQDLQQKFSLTKNSIKEKLFDKNQQNIQIILDFEVFLNAFVKFLKEIYEFYRNSKKSTLQQKYDFNKPSGFMNNFLESFQQFQKTYLSYLEIFKNSIAKGTYLISIFEDFNKNIIQNDIKTLTKLCTFTTEFEDCLYDIQNNLLKEELIIKKSYHNLQNITNFDLKKMRESCIFFSKKIKEYMNIEEISQWSTLIDLFTKKMMTFNNLIIILEIISTIYEQIPRYFKHLNEVIKDTNAQNVMKSLELFDDELDDIIKIISKSCDNHKCIKNNNESELLDKELQKIFKDDIIGFYNDNRKWCRYLSDSLYGIAEFYKELNRKYQNKIVFLRDDWIILIKESTERFFMKFAVGKDIICKSYTVPKKKLEKFYDELRELYSRNLSQKLIELIDCIQYLNENFLTEWFFNITNNPDDKNTNNKLMPKLIKLQKKMINKHINHEYFMNKIEKLHEQFAKVNYCVNFLKNEALIHTLGFDFVVKFDVITTFWEDQSIYVWPDILQIIKTNIYEPKKLQKFKENYPECIDLIRVFEQKINELNDFQINFITHTWSFFIQND